MADDNVKRAHFPQSHDCGLIEGARHTTREEAEQAVFPQSHDCGLIEGPRGCQARPCGRATFPQSHDCGLIEGIPRPREATTYYDLSAVSRLRPN